jgi:membrane protease YdiL (CAAX protease family)
MRSMFESANRRQFLTLATMLEGGLIALALALGWLAGIRLPEALDWHWQAVAGGAAAAMPMFALFVLSQRYPIGALGQIKRFLVEALGPSLAACRWYDLVYLALSAGIGEELFFRGVLQPWFGQWGPAAGLIGSNIVFGLAHLITPLYAILAGVTGVYLGLLLDVTGRPNLVVPIVTHALYDYLAFLVVVRAYRQTFAAKAALD